MAKRRPNRVAAGRWHLRPGQRILRTALHRRYGGAGREESVPRPKLTISSSSRIRSPVTSTATSTGQMRMVSFTTTAKGKPATSRWIRGTRPCATMSPTDALFACSRARLERSLIWASMCWMRGTLSTQPTARLGAGRFARSSSSSSCPSLARSFLPGPWLRRHPGKGSGSRRDPRGTRRACMSSRHGSRTKLSSVRTRWSTGWAITSRRWDTRSGSWRLFPLAKRNR